MENPDKLIIAVNEVLTEKKMYYKELYEHLIGKGMVKPNTEPQFRQFYNWALGAGLIERSRIKLNGKKRGKLPRYFTKTQLVQLFDTIDRPKDSLACFVALMGGLRINEVCTLKIKNIDFENHRFFIQDSKNTNRTRDNYGKDRYVDFDPAIDNILKTWIEIIGAESEYLFPSDKSPDQHLTKKSLGERFRGCLKEAGLLEVDYTLTFNQKINGKIVTKKVNRHKHYFHCLRHTIAVIMYSKTSDIYAVSKFLGHNQLDTTAIYAKVTDEKMKETVSTVFSSLHNDYFDGKHLTDMRIRKPQHQVANQEQGNVNNILNLIGGDVVNKMVQSLVEKNVAQVMERKEKLH